LSTYHVKQIALAEAGDLLVETVPTARLTLSAAALAPSALRPLRMDVFTRHEISVSGLAGEGWSVSYLEASGVNEVSFAGPFGEGDSVILSGTVVHSIIVDFTDYSVPDDLVVHVTSMLPGV
jgi:hypothetical protein